MSLFYLRLCPALKAVFEYGLRRSSLLGGPGHPWLFIEEVFIITFNTKDLEYNTAKTLSLYVSFHSNSYKCIENSQLF